jgi:hypothetical protein
MDRDEGLWHELAAGVQSSLDADLRDDAYEVFVAEVSRCRLVDRVGRARVLLRCGATVEGDLAPQGDGSVDDHLLVRTGDGDLLVPTTAIAAMSGSRTALRGEGAPVRTLASWLREAWAADGRVRLLDGTGRWLAGRIDMVGADHVELDLDGVPTVVPCASVDAWQRC